MDIDLVTTLSSHTKFQTEAFVVRRNLVQKSEKNRNINHPIEAPNWLISRRQNLNLMLRNSRLTIQHVFDKFDTIQCYLFVGHPLAATVLLLHIWRIIEVCELNFYYATHECAVYATRNRVCPSVTLVINCATSLYLIQTSNGIRGL